VSPLGRAVALVSGPAGDIGAATVRLLVAEGERLAEPEKLLAADVFRSARVIAWGTWAPAAQGRAEGDHELTWRLCPSAGRPRWSSCPKIAEPSAWGAQARTARLGTTAS
jgi:hypothetical protein